MEDTKEFCLCGLQLLILTELEFKMEKVLGRNNTQAHIPLSFITRHVASGKLCYVFVGDYPQKSK